MKAIFICIIAFWAFLLFVLWKCVFGSASFSDKRDK